MATFFGEVTELSSRAVWWSDSEDEELSSGNNNSPAKSVKDYSFHLDVKNAVSLDEFKNEYSRLFVSVVKSDRHFKNLNACVKLQLKASKDGQDVHLGSLYKLGSTQFWFVIFKKQLTLFNHLIVRAVNYVFDNLFSSKSLIILVSKDLNKIESAQYITTRTDDAIEKYLSEWSRVDLQMLLPPDTVKEDFEFALIEYCIVNKVNLVCFVLPVASNNIDLIPSCVKNTINEFYDLSYSNIMT